MVHGKARVRCYTRAVTVGPECFPTIVEPASRLKASSLLIDGEAVICRQDGLSDFHALRSRRRDHQAMLFAFGL